MSEQLKHCNECGWTGLVPDYEYPWGEGREYCPRCVDDVPVCDLVLPEQSEE